MQHISILTKKDLAIGNYIIYINTTINLVFILIFAIIWSFPSIDVNNFFDFKNIILILLHFIILFILMFPFSLIYSLFIPMINKGVLGKHYFTFTDEGILEKTDYNESLHKYTSINKVFTQYGSIYIIFSGMHTHILPERDFYTEDEKDILPKYLQKKSKEYNFKFQSNKIYQ